MHVSFIDTSDRVEIDIVVNHIPEILFSNEKVLKINGELYSVGVGGSLNRSKHQERYDNWYKKYVEIPRS